MTDEFTAALRKVLRDVNIDGGRGADLVAVGIKRDDCLEFLEDFLVERPMSQNDFAVQLAVLTQMCVAIGVWIERARWETPCF